MAHAELQSVKSVSTGTVLTGLIARMREGLARHRLYLVTRNELNALSDAELADIGIGRGLINHIARDAANNAEI